VENSLLYIMYNFTLALNFYLSNFPEDFLGKELSGPLCGKNVRFFYIYPLTKLFFLCIICTGTYTGIVFKNRINVMASELPPKIESIKF